MKMTMVFKYRDGRPNETHYYNTKKECDDHFNYVTRYRIDEISTVWIGPTYKGLEKIKLETVEEIKTRLNI